MFRLLATPVPGWWCNLPQQRAALQSQAGELAETTGHFVFNKTPLRRVSFYHANSGWKLPPSSCGFCSQART